MTAETIATQSLKRQRILWSLAASILPFQIALQILEKKRFLEEVIYEKAVEEAMVQGGMVSLEIDDDELYGILIFEGKELMRVHQDDRMDELVQDLLRESTYYYMNAKENEIHLEFHFRLAEETV